TRSKRDWSSDVCSSDLADYLADEPGAWFSSLASYRVEKKFALRRYRTECAGSAVGRVKALAAQRLEFGPVVIVQAQQITAGFKQIGRASCRESREKWVG